MKRFSSLLILFITFSVSLSYAQKSAVSKSEKDLSILMKDINMTTKWGLAMTDSAKAWNVTKGSKDIVIAIIDTGADIRHPSLQSNLWVNKGEVGTDKNGNDKATNSKCDYPNNVCK